MQTRRSSGLAEWAEVRDASPGATVSALALALLDPGQTPAARGRAPGGGAGGTWRGLAAQ